MKAAYLLIQESTTMYPAGTTLEIMLLMVVYFQKQSRKRKPFMELRRKHCLFTSTSLHFDAVESVECSLWVSSDKS